MVGAIAAALAFPGVAAAEHGHGGHGHASKGVKRIVVIYEENHSFDNLYGGWEGVNGRAKADAAHTTQVNQAGTPYTCLLQDDVNLATPPQPATCTDTTTATTFQSNFPNAPFQIDTPGRIPMTAKTCPAPGVFAPNGVLDPTRLPGGCTRDLVHRYYQEQYQLDGGKQDRYVTGSDAVGLTMGYYDTTSLPIYKYLHTRGHPPYAIADDFFQSAFGGSFLNHQWLVAAGTPTWPGAVNDGSATDLHSVVDANGMPTTNNNNPSNNPAPLYNSPLTAGLADGALTASCNPPAGRPPTPAGVTCGDFAVNTIQPTYQPFSPGTADARKLPPQTAPTIGDRLSAKRVDWAWYSGGWSNADGDVNAPGWTNGTAPAQPTATNPKPCPDPAAFATATWPNCPDKLFQFHHQPLNYFASFAPGTAARTAHLRDEAEFEALAKSSKKHCALKPVSFIKPIGAENEHPGYTNVGEGSGHLVELLQAIEGSRCAKDTMVVVTYDEFGGQWDHVSSPGQGGTPGAHDKWGPGTRIPALVVSPRLRGDFVVDQTQYDTTSILATIERRFGLAPLTSRDAAVNSMFNVFSAKPPRHKAFTGSGPQRRGGQRD
jgi:acid phosphatase